MSLQVSGGCGEVGFALRRFLAAHPRARSLPDLHAQGILAGSSQFGVLATVRQAAWRPKPKIHKNPQKGPVPACSVSCALEPGESTVRCERKSLMYAVIKTGGKQYKVAAGEKIKVELLDAEVGAEVTLDQVLALGSGDGLKVGAPLVAGATVSAKVVSHGKHDKVRIFKMRRRKHYKKSQGHRQNYTELEISAVNG